MQTEICGGALDSPPAALNEAIRTVGYGAKVVVLSWYGQPPNVRPGAEDNLGMVTTRVQAQGHDDVRIRLLRSSNAGGGPAPRVVLDTDTYNEIDDQFALVHVLLSPERVRLEAIYAAPFHNSRSSGPGDGMRKSFEEIHRVLEVVGHVGPPVLEGATEWLTHSKSVSASPATEDLIERAQSDEGGPLYVVAIGAPTNIISALLLAPEIVEHVVVIWLGGNSLYWPTAREFNLEQDPKASQALFDCGVALVHVPCFNVADHLTTTRARSRPLCGAGRKSGRLFGRALQAICR